MSRTVAAAPTCLGSRRHPQASKARTERGRPQRSQSGTQGKANVPPSSCRLRKITAGVLEEEKPQIHEDDVGSLAAAPAPLCILCSRPKDMNVSASCRPQDAAGPTPTRANSAQQKQRLFFHCGAASQPMNPSCNNASQLSLTKSTHGWQLQTAEFHTSHHLGRFSSVYFTCSIGEPNVS